MIWYFNHYIMKSQSTRTIFHP